MNIMNLKSISWKLGIIILILLSIVMRLFGSQMVLFGDETLFAENVRDEEYINYYAAHPPLALWILTFFSNLLNPSVITMRLITSFFSVITILVTFLIAKHYFSEKTSFLSLLFLVSSPWFLAGSLQLDIVGSFLTCFYMISLFFYLKFLEKNKFKYIMLSGIAVGLSLLINYGAALMIPIISFHYLLHKYKFPDFSYYYFLKILFIFISSATIIFAIFPIWSFFIGSPTFVNSVTHPLDLIKADPGSGLRPSEGIDFVLLIVQYMNALVWIGPLILFVFVLSMLNRTKDNYLVKNLFLVQITVVFFFFTFVIKDNFRPIEKYLLVLAPGLSILSANYLEKVFNKKRELFLFAALFLLGVIFFNVLSVNSDNFISFYPKQNYLRAALDFNWSLKVPLLGHAGPVGFYVPLNFILISFILSGLLSLLYFFLKFKHFANYFLVFLLAVGLSYNVFFVQELLFSPTGPNINKITKEMIFELQKTKYSEPLYIFRNVAFKYYLYDQYHKIDQMDFDDENLISNVNKLSNSTLALINFPKINEESLLWKKIKDCKILKEFYDKEQRIGFISEC